MYVYRNIFKTNIDILFYNTYIHIEYFLISMVITNRILGGDGWVSTHRLELPVCFNGRGPSK